MKFGRKHLKSRRHRHIFWQVYWHSFAMLFIVFISMATVGALLRSSDSWDVQPRTISEYLSLRYADLSQNPAQLQKELDFLYGLGRPLSATIYDVNGQLMATNIEPPLPALEDKDAQRLDEGPHHKWFSSKWGHMVAMPLYDDGKVVAYVRSTFHPIKDHKLWRFIAVAFTLFGVLALTSFKLVRRIVQPMTELTDAVKRFGEGDLNVRLNASRVDEVGQLARAFDHMANRIQVSIDNQKQLLADVSHELRTPMARIRVALELADEGDAQSAKLYLSEIATDLQELETLVEDVLTAARLDLTEGTAHLANHPLRLGQHALQDIVEKACSRFRKSHPERQLDCIFETPLPMAEVDANLFRRVLDNLLDNARKYSDAPSPITVETRVEAHQLEITVKDEGIGIAEGDMASIFLPFYRVDSSRSKESGGLGLGLALARRIMHAHGGEIEVQSQAKVGSRFILRLPR